MTCICSKICIAALLFLFVNYSKQESVEVSVYYESLCPDSVYFIVSQLYPGYQKLKDALQLKFIPFGFAHFTKENGHWQFYCQHGRSECRGNKIQACALAQNVTTEKKADYIYCLMKKSTPADSKNAEDCAKETELSWTSIEKCTTDGQGDDLLVGYGNLTKAVKPEITYIPTIVFNGIFNQSLQNDAEFDFLNTVCKLFATAPQGCIKYSNKPFFEDSTEYSIVI